MSRAERQPVTENIVQLPSSRRGNLPAPPSGRAQPSPIVPFESWVQAKDRAAAVLLGGNARLLVTGPAGTGKTVLLDHLARVLRAAGRTVMVQLADADPAPPGPGNTLFVDEADRLSATNLRRLLDGTGGTVVLAGLDSLARRVGSDVTHLTLEPLGQEAARSYIAQWLSLNGRTPADLDSKAVRRLAELSGGVPRLLSTLLAAGAWLAESSGAPVIEARHIEEAAELRSVLTPASEAATEAEPPVRRSRVVSSALLAAALLAGTAIAVAPQLFPSEMEAGIAHVTALGGKAERWVRAELGLASPPAPAAKPAAVATIPPPTPIPAPPREPAQALNQPPPTPVETKSEPPPPASPPPSEPVKAMAEPPPAAVQPAEPTPKAEVPAEATAPTTPPAPKPVIATPRAAPTPPPLPIETVTFLIRRGREMIALGDISAARLLFGRAAESGNAEAMTELARTYDPTVQTGINADQASPADAVRWYRRAADARSAPQN